jgi:inorganic pyrophosphatase
VSATQFWSALDALLGSARLVIDRPGGSEHPRYSGLRYPFDYGYLEGTRSGDGEGVDVWVGSLVPARLEGVVCTVDVVKRDVELKLLLGCTEAERRAILAFHNSGSQAGILVERATRDPGGQTLTTPRLQLRPFEDGDAAVLREQWNEPDVRRFLFDDEPVSAGFVAGQIRASRASFAARGFGLFTIALREAAAETIGFVGLRTFGPEDKVELLYALRRSSWGRRYATEASEAVLRHAFEALGLPEIWAGADPPNEASFRVMHRLGMPYREELPLHGRPVRYHSIRRQEYLERARGGAA